MKSLKIAFDAKRLFLNNTGLGSYSRNLVRYLQQYYPKHEYHLFTPRTEHTEDTDYFLNPERFKVHTSPNLILSWWWRSKGLVESLDKESIDIYHGLSGELPFGIERLNLKRIVTIHDVIFKLRPKDYTFIDRKIYDYKTRHACRVADHIICVSRQSLLDLGLFYPDSMDKSEVVYPAQDPSFFSHSFPESRAPIHARNKILLFGSFNPRKNMMNALIAYREFSKQEAVGLVLIGNGRKFEKQINPILEELAIKNDVTVYTDLTQAKLVQMMKASSLILYPSLYEGFGLPALESLHLEKKIVCGYHSGLKEAMPFPVFVCDVEDPDAIAMKMKALIKKEFDDCVQVNNQKQHLGSFDPKILSKELIDCYIS